LQAHRRFRDHADRDAYLYTFVVSRLPSTRRVARRPVSRYRKPPDQNRGFTS
jgi:hypothetical protein